MYFRVGVFLRGSTVEPLNKGHVGTRLYREVSFIWKLKCTGIIGIRTSTFMERCPLSLSEDPLYFCGFVVDRQTMTFLPMTTLLLLWYICQYH